MSFDPITAALDIGGKLIDRLFPNPAQRDAAKLELLRMQQAGELAGMTAQTEINKAEAGNSSLFVAGWRPWIGWVCGMAFAWNWIGLPVTSLILGVAGKTIAVGPADLSEMMPVLLGMLGLGALRTVEKVKGVAK